MLKRTLNVCFTLVASFCALSFSFETEWQSPDLQEASNVFGYESRIIGGAPTAIEKVPYQAGLFRNSHVCGGAIISRQWILTAAHCVVNTNNLQVYVGSNVRRNATFYRVANVVSHPSFDYARLDYDIALLRINGALNYSSKIQPIRLTSVQPKPGSVVTASGWGVTSVPGGVLSSLLMKVDIPVVERSLCERLYSPRQNITSRMLCAGDIRYGGKDSCQGDSGGPLAANGTLYGIVSWGRSCAQPSYPGVYTNVAILRQWIRKISGI